MPVFDVEVCFLFAGSFFHSHSVSLSFYCRIDVGGTIVFVCVYMHMCIHSFVFAGVKLFIFCVFIVVVNLHRMEFSV